MSALVFGAADFLGGLGSRRISPLRVAAIAGSVGFCILLLANPFAATMVGGEWTRESMLLGGLSGVAGALATTLLYACLAVGPMSILSPLTAVVSAIVPLSFGIARGESLGGTGYVAIVLALAGVVLVGFVREKRMVRARARGVVMAIGAGAMIGAFVVIIDRTPDRSGLVPLIMNRAVNVSLTFVAIGAVALLVHRRSRSRPVVAAHAAPEGGLVRVRTGQVPPAGTHGWLPGLRFAVACGIVDAVATVGLLLGLRNGDLSVIAVLTALYPAGTVILAAVVLGERVAPVQYVGLALAVAAGALFALA